LEVMIAPQPQPITSLVAGGVPTAYADLPEMKRLNETSQMDAEGARVLADPKTPIDQKLALSVAWAQRFSFSTIAPQYAALAYKTPIEKLKLDSLRGDELLVLGILSLSVPGQPAGALKLLEKAKKKLPTSFTAALALAVIKGELAMEKSDSCAMFRLPVAVLRDETLTLDLRQSAIDAVFDQASSYRDSCPKRGVR
jgi:hypothetical protein